MRTSRKLIGSLGIAAVALVAATVVAQQAKESKKDAAKTKAVAAAINPNEWSVHWLGIQVLPVSAALRSQLNLPEKQGLLIGSVVQKSPAEKAGIVRHDILLKAADKPLGTPRQLLAVLDEAKETKIKIELLRGGKPMAIEATPAKRPSPLFLGSDPFEESDWDAVQKWMDDMVSGHDRAGNRAPVRFQIVQPGAIVPKNALPTNTLPNELSISISKSGNQPAKIEVARGADKWSLTENNLDQLPADVRGHVERMLGRNQGFSGSLRIVPQFSGMPMPATMNALPKTPEEMHRHMQKQIEEMNRRIETMHKMIQEQQNDLTPWPQSFPQSQEPKKAKEPMLPEKHEK